MMEQVDLINTIARRTETHLYENDDDVAEAARHHIAIMEDNKWQVRQIAPFGNRIFVVFERML